MNAGNQGSGAVLVSVCTSGTTVLATEKSEHPKALAALTDGELQHLVQLLVGVVGREAQLVKTRRKRTPAVSYIYT